MCGIMGFSGKGEAKEKIIEGLYSLEYRGYDSAGITVGNSETLQTVKCKGRVSVLDEKAASITDDCFFGIGHTRWATHGEPSKRNAHPHSSESVTLVHNGIIENYLEIRELLSKEGYFFRSETDTECVVHLIDREYKKHHEPWSAINSAISILNGSFALAIIFHDRIGEIWAVRRNNPLILSCADGSSYLASDIPAILRYSKSIMRLADDEIACLKAGAVISYDKSGTEKSVKFEDVPWNFEMARKDGYEHFMLKEIHEQPEAASRTVKPYISSAGLPTLEKIGISNKLLSEFDGVSIIACGSAYHAGIVGKNLIEKMVKIPVFVTLASEYRYDPPVVTKNPLIIAISQSGETADTLAALKLAKELGAPSLGIINTVGSAIARESDYVLYTNAGPEISVATTKGYITQLSAMFLIAAALAHSKGNITDAFARNFLNVLSNDVPAAISNVISRRSEIVMLAKEIVDKNDLYFIGRGCDYAASIESSLKLKEISYIHSEAYAAGELKHGTLSLITDGVPVVVLACDEKYHDKMIGNIRETRARGAFVILVCKDNMKVPEFYSDRVFFIPKLDGIFTPFVSVVFSQLLAYETAFLRGFDIDRPRNLAKSVTVE